MEFPVPELGEGVFEAELVTWLVSEGDTVRRGQGLMEVLTDKATMEVPSPFAGKISSLIAEEGKPIKVGEIVLTYEPSEPTSGDLETTVGTKKQAPAQKKQKSPAKKIHVGNGAALAGNAVKAAPSVRLMARKLGIDLEEVTGSGPNGRILFEDLTSKVQAPSVEKPLTPVPDYGTPGTLIKLKGLRRKIAEHMVHSKQTIPHYGYVDECDVTELVRIRESLKELAAERGTKLTYLPFVVKAAVSALKSIPIVNSSLDKSSEEIVFHDRYHIGFAVATPQGLIVPVIKDADQKNLFEIAKEIERLGQAARGGKIEVGDLRDGTFTITSIGNIGGLFSTPVINHPEVGILGIGKVVKRPVFDDKGNVVPADLMYLSFSFDHRVVDGAVGAEFGNRVIQELSQPARLLV